MSIQVRKMGDGVVGVQHETEISKDVLFLSQEDAGTLLLKLPVDVEVPGNEISILTDVGNGNLCLLIGKATIEITTDKKFRDRMMRALTASHDYQNLQEA